MPPTKRRAATRNLVVFGIIGLVLAGLGAWSLLKKRETAIVVQTDKVARRDVTETVVATGRIQPVTQVVINPEVSGEIVDLPVREGQKVNAGDLLVRIRPDPYIASRNSAEASHRSALASVSLARAELEKARLEFNRFEQLYRELLISESDYLSARTSLDVAQARYETVQHQADQARASLDRAEEDLAKTTIVAPISGTLTSLKSERGERVVGTAMMAGTEIMTISDLGEMEARVDVGEIDVVLVRIGQKATLEVDAFRDRKFTGVVTEIANTAKTTAAGAQQEATKFEVRIRVQEKEPFRPGMSVTAEIETRHRTNVLTVPIQCVTTRPPKKDRDAAGNEKAVTSSVRDRDKDDENPAGARKDEKPKLIEVVFTVNDGKAVMRPVTRGISDDDYTEITEGLEEGQEVVSGGYKVLTRELEDGKLVRVDNSSKPAGRDAGADEP
jgi:HlyD family secretion protein